MSDVEQLQLLLQTLALVGSDVKWVAILWIVFHYGSTLALVFVPLYLVYRFFTWWVREDYKAECQKAAARKEGT